MSDERHLSAMFQGAITTPCPFDFADFWAEHGWLTPAQFGLATALTMFIWNAPGHRLRFDRAQVRDLFNPSVSEEDLTATLANVFWIWKGEIYSPWVLRWLGVPQRRTPIPTEMRMIVRTRDRNRRGELQCSYCGKVCTMEHHLDHMLPMSRGGIHHPDNLCIACPPCNTRKGGMTYEEFNDLLCEEEPS
jgi:hypothetical protein